MRIVMVGDCNFSVLAVDLLRKVEQGLVFVFGT